MMRHNKRSLILLPVLLLMMGFPWAQAREARSMSRHFFVQILFTAVGSEFSDDVNSTLPLNNWTIQTEWNWNYSKTLQEEQGKEFPYIFCDDNPDRTSLERRKAIADQTGSTLNDTYTIFNVPYVTCVVAVANYSVAQGLGEFIVQPIGFILKINSGTVDFVSDETKATEYSVQICPGLPWLNLTDFFLETLDMILPMINFLLTVPEVDPFAPDLVALQEQLVQDPDYCDAILNNLEVEQAGIDYVILRLNVTEEGFAPEACFLLLALGLAHAPEICFIERRAPYVIGNVEAQWITQSGVQNERPFFRRGITGKGQVIALSDTGLDLNSCYFRDALVDNFEFGTTFNNSNRKVIQYVNYVDSQDYTDGHGSHCAGTIAGRKAEDGINETDGFVDGIAIDAKLAFFDIGLEDRLKVPGADSLMSPGATAGALTHSCSWGSKSRFYTNQDRDFDRYVYQNPHFAIVVAAGNSGPAGSTVGSPANAKNVITVGASTSAGMDVKPNQSPIDELARFSSRGPSMDKRFKPDVVAPGSYILSVGAKPEESCDPPSVNDLPGPGEKNSTYGVLSLQGTSMATPVVSGTVGLIRQYFQEGWHGDGTKGSAPTTMITAAMAKAILVNGAQALQGFDFDSVNHEQGFGRISLIDSLPLAGENELIGDFRDNETIVQGAEPKVYEFDIDISNLKCTDPGFSVTLSWIDPPGYTSCLRCLISNLDLNVKRTLEDGTSTDHFPNGLDSADSLNNVERTRIGVADGDSVRVTVSSTQQESSQQNFALATVYGCFTNQYPATAAAPSLAVEVLVSGVSRWVTIGVSVALLLATC